jgi:hypothetical protein
MKTIIVMRFVCLIAAETARSFARKGLRVVGIDNDMRKYFLARVFQQNGATANLPPNSRTVGITTSTFATKIS